MESEPQQLCALLPQQGTKGRLVNAAVSQR